MHRNKLKKNHNSYNLNLKFSFLRSLFYYLIVLCLVICSNSWNKNYLPCSNRSFHCNSWIKDKVLIFSLWDLASELRLLIATCPEVYPGLPGWLQQTTFLLTISNLSLPKILGSRLDKGLKITIYLDQDLAQTLANPTPKMLGLGQMGQYTEVYYKEW